MDNSLLAVRDINHKYIVVGEKGKSANADFYLIFTEEKKCDCIRSDMTSGAETIGSVDKILYFDFLCI